MDSASDRGTRNAPLGECPDCQATISSENSFIQYIPRNDWPRMIAKCPSCEGPVSPV